MVIKKYPRATWHGIPFFVNERKIKQEVLMISRNLFHSIVSNKKISISECNHTYLYGPYKRAAGEISERSVLSYVIFFGGRTTSFLLSLILPKPSLHEKLWRRRKHGARKSFTGARKDSITVSTDFFPFIFGLLFFKKKLVLSCCALI